jgi:uncharacterized protein (TIGR02145 family)
MKKKLTKTGLIIALAFICTNIVSAQNYMITFSGSGQSNVVEAVEVKNTTQQTSVTLNGTDTLHLVDVVGISQIVLENAGMRVYPNPTRHTSRVEFYNSEDGNVTVEIIDITGKTLSALSVNLSRGLQAFEIQGLGTGIYLLKATTETTVHQQRLITYAQSFGNPQINYLGSFDLSMTPAQMKSTKNIVEMQYNDGERLVTKGISGDYSHTMSLIPSESQNIDFDFIECVDGDGNHYGVVTIGEQVWIAENLKTTRDAAGNNITRYCYENNTTTCELYGGLYTWATVMNGAGSSSNNPSGVQGICPDGWHVPSHHEWTQLEQYICNALGNSNCETQFPYDHTTWGWRGTNEGNALKSCRQVNSPLGGDCNTSEHPRWNSHSTHHGFDEFGFSALPGGGRYTSGGFGKIGYFGYWWSSTEHTSTGAWSRGMSYYYGDVYRYSGYKPLGFSVRCLRDID